MRKKRNYFTVNKMVSFAEYSGVMTQILGELAVAAGLEEKLVMVYGRLDADSNGQLTAAEMRALVPAMDKDGMLLHTCR